MATSKKKVPAKAAPVKTTKANASKKSKPGVAGALPVKRSKAWLVPVIMVAVLLGVGTQIYMRSSYLASLKFDMVRLARTVPQGQDRGQAQALVAAVGDKRDQTFVLEGNDAVPTRVQRFDARQSPESLVYKALKPEQILTPSNDMDVDGAGNVYVLQRDGIVQVLSNDLKWIRSFKTNVRGPMAITANSVGRVYVASAEENKVVYFDAKGALEGEMGAAGTGSAMLVAPVRLRATAEDQVVVLERTENGLRGKVFRPDHTLQKTFLVEKLQNCEPVKLGVNGAGKAFLNDHMGTRGIVAYDIATGKFFGESQATDDGEKFISPGALGANRYTPAVFVHTVTGLIKCALPAPNAPETEVSEEE